MADELRVKVSSDVSEFKEGFDDAGRSVEQFQSKVDDATKSTVDLGKKGKLSTKDLISEISKMSGAERSISNYRRQLSQMTKDIQDLTINYRAMSDEMKNSDIGRETLQRINELTLKASEYKDAVLDAQQAIKVAASDTANWDAAKQGIQSVSAALQGLAASGVLGENATEDLVKVIAKLKAIEAATNSVITIGNALQKQSALMTGIARLQTVALTKAKAADTVVTKGATIAQKALNAVAKANPYVLLATAILTVVGAIASWMYISKKNIGVQNDLASAQDKVNEAVKGSHEEAGKSIAKFKLLETQYKKLKSEAEKQTWINKHKDEFKDLNISIKDVNDADDVFIKHAADVVKAMRLRAEAAAIMTQYQEDYAKAYKKSLEIEEGKQASYSSSSTVRKEWKEAGLQSGVDYVNNPITMQSTAGAFSQNVYSLTPEGEQKMKDYWKKQGEEYIKSFSEGMQGSIRLMEEKIAEAEELESKSHITHDNNGGNGGKKPEPDYQNEIKQLQDQNSKLEEQKLLVEHLSDAWKEYELQIQNNNKRIEELKSQEEDWKKSLEPREPLTLPIQPKLINNKVEYQGEGLKIPVRFSPEELQNAYKDAASKAGDISEQLRLGVIDKRQAEMMIEALNDDLRKKGIKIPVELDFNEFEEQIENIQSKMESVTDIFAGPINAINSIKNAYENMMETMEDPEADGWEQFFSAFQFGVSIIEAVSTVLTTLNTIMALASALKKKDTTETQQNTLADAASIPVKTASAAANIAEGATAGVAAAGEGAKGVASIPIVGWVLAGVAIATIMAAILAAVSAVKGFAEGGIVGGHSYTGDKILARLNSGELILNQQQQASLLDKMDKNAVVISNEEGIINIPETITLTANGDTLEAVLTNTRNKSNRI